MSRYERATVQQRVRAEINTDTASQSSSSSILSMHRRGKEKLVKSTLTCRWKVLLRGGKPSDTYSRNPQKQVAYEIHTHIDHSSCQVQNWALPKIATTYGSKVIWGNWKVASEILSKCGVFPFRHTFKTAFDDVYTFHVYLLGASNQPANWCV